MNDTLDRFGELLMKRVRDKAIGDWQQIIAGEMKGATAKRVREQLASFTPEEKTAIAALIPQIIDTTLYHLLSTVEQEPTLDLRVKGAADTSQSLRGISDGLPGELFGDRGWIARFSTK